MKNINIDVRIKRNQLDKFAGIHYRDNDSDLIKKLKALVGIERQDGVYTVISENFIYYSTILNKEKKISLSDFLEILKYNALSKGKSSDFEYIYTNDGESIWIKNANTMNALWNTVLYIYNI